MLDILESLNREEVAQALAATTHALSPSPDVALRTESPSVPLELISRVVRELKQHLHLREDDNSPRAQAKMFGLLSKIISEQFLADNDADVRRRLGRRGDLAPADYSIRLDEGTERVAQQFGIRKKQIMEVLQRPHKVEHLLPEKVEAGDAPAVSLYLRQIGVPHTRDSHYLLVQTWRRYDEQEVVAAFQVFHQEVAVELDASPLKALQRFVDVYGLPFKMGSVEVEKFVLHEIRPLPVDKFDLNKLIHVETPNDERYAIYGLVRESDLGALEVAVAYAVNLNAYADDLRRHGVNVTWHGQQFGTRFFRLG